MDQHEEIWLVQLSNGAVRAMTLDELDAAYQDGSIDEETFVRRDGASTWVKLRDELGGDEPAPQPAAQPAPRPMSIPTPAPVSYGAVPAYPQPQALYSVRPVVSEIDMDELELGAAFKKSRKGLYAAIGGIAAVVVGAAVFAATHASAPADATTASVANAVQPPQVVTPPPPPVTPEPASTLTEDQKKALANLDQTDEKTWEQKRKARESHHASPAWHPSHTPFHKGGNKYDPLNAKL